MNPNGQGPQGNPEADFWRQKYLELLLHTPQVATMLAQPFLAQQQRQQLQAMQAMAQGQPAQTTGDPQ